jgi:hypothetical protein
MCFVLVISRKVRRVAVRVGSLRRLLLEFLARRLVEQYRSPAFLERRLHRLYWAVLRRVVVLAQVQRHLDFLEQLQLGQHPLLESLEQHRLRLCPVVLPRLAVLVQAVHLELPEQGLLQAALPRLFHKQLHSALFKHQLRHRHQRYQQILAAHRSPQRAALKAQLSPQIPQEHCPLQANLLQQWHPACQAQCPTPQCSLASQTPTPPPPHAKQNEALPRSS